MSQDDDNNLNQTQPQPNHKAKSKNWPGLAHRTKIRPGQA